jgi:hypothetical protein
MTLKQRRVDAATISVWNSVDTTDALSSKVPHRRLICLHLRYFFETPTFHQNNLHVTHGRW